MDIVDFWNKQVTKWQEDQKCGLCWEFGAPLVNSQINIQQSAEPCCVQVMLTNIRYRKNIVRNNITQFITSESCTWTATVYAVQEMPIGVNNYNEIKDHPISESKWTTVFNPILECLGCENLLDYCVILGKDVIINQIGDAELIHNYLDKNLNGWRITYSFTFNN